MAAAFKQFRYCVMVAGEKAMGEGNSFEQCKTSSFRRSNGRSISTIKSPIAFTGSTSKEAVYIFGCVTENTVDERLYALYTEKGDPPTGSQRPLVHRADRGGEPRKVTV